MMKKTISVLLVIVSVFLFCGFSAAAADSVDRIDFTVRSDIAGYTYRDYTSVYSISPDSFRYLYSPIAGSAMTAYHDGQAYRGAFQAGETYTLKLSAYYPGELEITDEFGVYLNGKPLSYANDEYLIVYNPSSNQTNVGVTAVVTVTEREDGGETDFFASLLQALRAFFQRILSLFGLA